MINISENANQVLNIVKARYNLKDKSQAIEKITLQFGQEIMEPELRPEFIQKMQIKTKEPTVKIKDFRKHFAIN